MILSMHPEELFASRALWAGASGYVQKDDAAGAQMVADRVSDGPFMR